MRHGEQTGLPLLRGRAMKQTEFSLFRKLMLWSGLLLAAISSAVLAAPPSNLEAVPDVDVTAEKPKTAPTAQEITQIREQNAVTSVRVKKGGNTYYVTPSEQFSSSQSGGRAAQWEIFEFRSKSKYPVIDNGAPPPPSR
jgi:hypothetical protein